MNKSNYRPKSKYLRNAYDSFYGYHYLTFQPYMLFKEGQEDEFLETINEFKNYYSDTGNADPVAEDALESIMQSSKLDWEKIWEKIDVKDYCGPLEKLFWQITHYISWNSFREKVSQCDDLVLVQILYQTFFRDRNVTSQVKNKEYVHYLKNTLNRMNKTPEDALMDLLEKYSDNFEHGYQPDTINDQLQKSKEQLFRILLQITNLNTKVEYCGKRTTIKNLLFYLILECGKISSWTRDGDYFEKPYLKVGHENQLKLLFNNCRNLTFKGYPINKDFDEYDRITLNIMMGELDKAFDIFNNNNGYKLYQSNQLTSLLETGMYHTDKTPFTDQFARIVRFIYLKQSKSAMEIGSLRNNFLEFIYSPRIKVISHATLNLLKTYLTEEEYASYLEWINDNNIPIYFGDYLGISNHMVRTIDNALNSDISIFERYELNTILDELNDCHEIVLKR